MDLSASLNMILLYSNSSFVLGFLSRDIPTDLSCCCLCRRHCVLWLLLISSHDNCCTLCWKAQQAHCLQSLCQLFPWLRSLQLAVPLCSAIRFLKTPLGLTIYESLLYAKLWFHRPFFFFFSIRNSLKTNKSWKVWWCQNLGSCDVKLYFI